MSESERPEGRRHARSGETPPREGEMAGATAQGAEAPPAGAPGSLVEQAVEEEAAEQIAALRRDLAERNDQLLRLAADFENFRRRKNQELADSARYAAEDATRALLPVLDNLRRAVDHLPGEDAGGATGGDASGQLHEGLRMVVLQFEQVLRQIGVEPVETVGSAFDPSIHEAIAGEESDTVERDTVIAEMQPGYRLHDRLLRPALVRVAHPRPGRGS